MNRSRSSFDRGRALVASFVAAAFTLSIAIAASPELHIRIHPDANKTEHTCAATLIGSGSYDHCTPALPTVSPAAPNQLPFVASLTSQWVRSTFLSALIFEHAPPTLA